MKRILLGLVICTVIPFSALAGEWEDKKFDFSLAFGFVPNAEIEGSFEDDFPADESFDFKADPIPLMRLIADYHIIPNLSVSANINYAAIQLEEELYLGTWDGEEHRVPQEIGMLELNLGIKGRFLINPKVVLKPGLYGGVRTTFSESYDGRQTGVALNGSVEVQYLLDQVYVFFDIGFLSQPYGGVEHVGYIRADPTLYLCIGLGI